MEDRLEGWRETRGKPDGCGVMEVMGGETREKSTLPATVETANEIKMKVVAEFGHYIMGLKFVT